MGSFGDSSFRVREENYSWLSGVTSEKLVGLVSFHDLLGG